MASWDKIDKNCWQHEAALVSINVIRSSASRPWKIILAGRNVWETLPGSFNLNSAKSVATKIARRYLREVAEAL